MRKLSYSILVLAAIYGWVNATNITTSKPHKHRHHRHKRQHVEDNVIPDVSRTDPRQRYQDPRYQDPRYQDPRYQSRYQDPRTRPDPRYDDPRYSDPRRTDPRYQDPRYHNYQDPRTNYPDPRTHEKRANVTLALDEYQESGNWGEWSEDSQCSRDCGGGVAYRTRVCKDVTADGRHGCTGPSRVYFSCNIQACPAERQDFRLEQCQQFNSNAFEGKHYSWIPYYKSPNPCELTCMPKGERFFHRHSSKVIDGTRCRDDGSLDICVEGQCMPVGCDNILGSKKKEDKCRQCGGTGEGCVTNQGVIEQEELPVGYNDILLIPRGATNIRVEEVHPTNNYLAIRNTTGHYYLNGNWRIEFPRNIRFAGTIFHYERKTQRGVQSPEVIWAQGPLTETIFMVLLYQEKNRGISYEYSLPEKDGHVHINLMDTYNWNFEDWGECSDPCGGGVQNRSVYCSSATTTQKAPEDLCNPSLKPATTRACNTEDCPAAWYIGEWETCSNTCGNGTQYRPIFCHRKTERGIKILNDFECHGQEKPVWQQECSSEGTCTRWEAGEWSECDVQCGAGTQIRDVSCVTPINETAVEIADDVECGLDRKPIANKTCSMPKPCEGVEWATTPWSGCSETCSSRTETRDVRCVIETGHQYPKETCDISKEPETQRECESHPGCEKQWFYSQWSKCSAKCGSGVKTRTVFCGMFEDNCLKNVSDSECNEADKEPEQQPCNATEKCKGNWFTAPWEQCTVRCGGGHRSRQVFCINPNGEPVSEDNCEGQEKPTDKQECNMEACEEDQIHILGGCKDTEFGCCPDFNTTKTSESYEGCPPLEIPEDGCRTTDYGCCLDGVTQALGPFKHGCQHFALCNGTRWGCCPDETSPAQGPDAQGCIIEPVPCNETAFGCCDDNETPALDAEASGCVNVTTPSLLEPRRMMNITLCEDTQFGCCLDNVTAAEGPNGTGCDVDGSGSGMALCAESTFGCCPDGFTPANDAEGTDCPAGGTEVPSLTPPKVIPCKEKEFGCCPDGETPALGPELEGCSNCSNSTYGCCEDHYHEALGENFEGCPNCTNSTWGCCQDLETEAQGPDFEGCPGVPLYTCKNSTYGCCGDLITEASGPDFQGCSENITCETSRFGCCENITIPALSRDGAGCDTCQNSLYGCCDDEVTFAVGPSKMGCCWSEPHGCCPDNKTVAKGPDYAGCSCHTLQYKCCPDNKTPAIGPRYMGCTCAHYPYGCCQDEHTPAGGPNLEGCLCERMLYKCCPDGVTPALGEHYKGCNCRTSEYGCCPDGRTSATGPDFRGCTCETMPYGCCPDRRTPARGQNFVGCPCQAMPYGCCGDLYTAAQGPNKEGCNCTQLHYRCCPDGVTPAQGPSYFGCPCNTLPHGCCPDGRTAARGPNNEGCTCSHTRYGCCPDNRTPAYGPNYENCAGLEPRRPTPTTPLASGEVCGLPKDVGPCRNFTVKWYFDTVYGGCARFWYGSCGGNENRFDSEEDCQATCISPQGPAVCQLPKIPGPCENQFPHWYFEKTSRTCQPFNYTGCLGNGNRFASKEICESTCIKFESANPCEQPVNPGPCGDKQERFYYDKQGNTCKRFIFGGCQGNSNNFANQQECSDKCVRPSPKVSVDENVCAQSKDPGPCGNHQLKWFFNSTGRRCEQFYYGGCEGNGNRFDGRSECERSCLGEPKSVVNVCSQPQEVGNCYDYKERWFYDAASATCRRFYYGGCDGNDNNFETFQDCERSCVRSQPTTVSPTPSNEAFKPEHCLLSQDPGPCDRSEFMWFYDKNDGVCREFFYGGCLGNPNRFKTARDCEAQCAATQDVCSLPKVQGPCSRAFVQFYYDPETDQCREFTYGGCQGNANRFDDSEACEKRCVKGTGGSLTPRRNKVLPDKCKQAPDAGPCYAAFQYFYYDSSSGMCKTFTYGGCQGNENRFRTSTECDRECSDFDDRHGASDADIGAKKEICNMFTDSGTCAEYHPLWFYDPKTSTCYPFVYGGCGGNRNRFKTHDECMEFCKGVEPIVSTDTSEEGEDETTVAMTTIDDYVMTTVAPLPRPSTLSPSECGPNNCERISCPLGKTEVVDRRGCVLCRCINPCETYQCGHGETCRIESYRGDDNEARYRPVCRLNNKPGHCPIVEEGANNTQHAGVVNQNCREVCRMDADCPRQYKCCHNGCAHVCVDAVLSEDDRRTMEASTTVTPFPRPTVAGYVSPQIIDSLPEVVANAGEDVTLRCTARGIPVPTVEWTYNDKPMESRDGRVKSLVDGSLRIDRIKSEDSGNYKCSASNGYGEPSVHTTRLVVYVPARIMPSKPVVVVAVKETANLSCIAVGFPHPSVAWSRNGVMLPQSSQRYRYATDSTLMILNVSMSDEDLYLCRAFNGHGKPAHWKVALTITAEDGTQIELDETGIRHRKSIVKEAKDHLAMMLREEQQQSGISSRVQEYDRIQSGLHQPSGGGGAAEMTHHMRKQAMTAEIRLQTWQHRIGSPIRIDCHVRGYPIDVVKWFRDDVELRSDNHVHIAANYSLSIEAASIGDSGEYRCVATNADSEAVSAVKVRVEEVPIPASCMDNPNFANCQLIVRARYCKNPHYAKFCCKSCMLSGQLRR